MISASGFEILNITVAQDFSDSVYPPSEDSYLLLDALESDWVAIKASSPTICVEVGCGSGIVSCSLARSLRHCGVVICTDIDPVSALVTYKSSEVNKCHPVVNPVCCDLITALSDRLHHCVDLLVFNPPYLPHKLDFDSTHPLARTWCGGGPDGSETARRLISCAHNVLSQSGLFYLVAVEENNVDVLVKLNPKLEGLQKMSILADLNIVRRSNQNPATLLSVVKFAVEGMKYDTLAINTEFLVETASETASELGSSKKKKRKTSFEVPKPLDIDISNVDTSALQANGKSLRIYSRLTIIASDHELLQQVMKHPNTTLYDLLAICPLSEQVFNICIEKQVIDIISTDMVTRQNWLLKRKTLKKAVRAGKMVEISYKPALTDSFQRVDSIAHGSRLFSAAGRDGIILTSRASRPIELRGPYDVINIGYLFGMTTMEARHAISVVPKKLLLRAESKKCAQGALVSIPVDQLPREDIEKLSEVPEFKAEMSLAKSND
ncbi:hemK methyltransferase family [Trichuris trichiura]|uniref:Methyltransferase HEMK2 n=1 Tax=Trichuris trichiura TaxID=36087 RepID=A0A077Z9J5_TRITR|nr:hemK methyltransferase family [Trichuris trichiura]